VSAIARRVQVANCERCGRSWATSQLHHCERCARRCCPECSERLPPERVGGGACWGQVCRRCLTGEDARARDEALAVLRARRKGGAT
jgi:hypothetical protein